METWLLLVLVGLTSVAAYVLGTRVLGRSPKGLRAALCYIIESAGFAAAFLVLNLVVGFVIVRVLPGLTGWAMSVYALQDSTLVALSALQGFTFRWWLDRG
jgi:hypothetical protein